MTAPRPGQVYTACDPRDDITIRIVAVRGQRADVVDARTGGRPRSILTDVLHASGQTGAGRVRRTGYRLVQDAPAPAGEARLSAPTPPADLCRRAAAVLRDRAAAAMHPGVGAALAKLLEHAADTLDATAHPGWQAIIAPHELAVARAVLGEEADQ